MTKIRQVILIVIGTIFVAIGLIGLLIPVMPTLPFLIVAGLCYIRSSKRLYNKLIQFKYFGPHIKNYVEYHAVTRKTKVYGVLLLWVPTFVTETASFILKWNIYTKITPVIIVSLVTWHILSLKTIEDINTTDDKNLN